MVKINTKCRGLELHQYLAGFNRAHSLRLLPRHIIIIKLAGHSGNAPLSGDRQSPIMLLDQCPKNKIVFLREIESRFKDRKSFVLPLDHRNKNNKISIVGMAGYDPANLPVPNGVLSQLSYTPIDITQLT